jgi:hypothetical protein
MIIDNETEFSLILSPPGYDRFNNEENQANKANVLHTLDLIIHKSVEEF